MGRYPDGSHYCPEGSTNVEMLVSRVRKNDPSPALTSRQNGSVTKRPAGICSGHGHQIQHFWIISPHWESVHIGLLVLADRFSDAGVDMNEEEWESNCVQYRVFLCLLGCWLQLTLLAGSFCSSCLKRF